MTKHVKWKKLWGWIKQHNGTIEMHKKLAVVVFMPTVTGSSLRRYKERGKWKPTIENTHYCSNVQVWLCTKDSRGEGGPAQSDWHENSSMCKIWKWTNLKEQFVWDRGRGQQDPSKTPDNKSIQWTKFIKSIWH